MKHLIPFFSTALPWRFGFESTDKRNASQRLPFFVVLMSMAFAAMGCGESATDTAETTDTASQCPACPTLPPRIAEPAIAQETLDLFKRKRVKYYKSLRTAIIEVQQQLTEAKTSLELLKAAKYGRTVTAKMYKVIEKKDLLWGGGGLEEADEAIPWAVLDVGPEASDHKFVLDYKYWMDVASKLPDEEAKTYFELLDRYNDGFALVDRMGEETGCTTLGDKEQTHYRILKMTHAVSKGDRAFYKKVRTEIKEIKQAVVQNLFRPVTNQGYGYYNMGFPHCNSSKKLLKEAKKIHRRIRLDKNDKLRLKYLIESGFMVQEY